MFKGEDLVKPLRLPHAQEERPRRRMIPPIVRATKEGYTQGSCPLPGRLRAHECQP